MIRRSVMGVIAVLAMAGAAPAKDTPGMDRERNEHGFTLVLAPTDPRQGWIGGVIFTISACPKPTCFHISGPLQLPTNEGGLAEGSFSIREADCELHFLEAPRNGMDSADLRVTPIASDQAGKGCDYLPAGLGGLYRY